MKAFFDTSVLFPVFQGEHIHHQASVLCVAPYDRSSGCCGVHSLAELYSTFTRLPGKQRKSVHEVLLFVENVLERLSTIALTADEYVTTLKATADLGITGGAVYDAMLAQCALKSGAEVIYTWNTRHYAQCGPEVVRRLRTP